jgi:hypothetical protein
MFLMHVGSTPVSDKLNDLPPFVFQPGKAQEVRDEFIAKVLLEHKGPEGLVEVKPIGFNEMGLPKFDLEASKREALEKLKEGRTELVKRYISTQQEYRISAGKPPLPPSPVVARIIEEEGIDLAAEGITLAGSGFKIGGQDISKRVETLESQLAMLLEQNKLLAEQNSLLKAKKAQ